MTLSSDQDIYRLEPGLPPGIAVLRVAVAETTTILDEISDERFTVAARVHSLRKFTKRMRSLFRLVREGFPDFRAANVTLRDTRTDGNTLSGIEVRANAAGMTNPGP